MIYKTITMSTTSKNINLQHIAQDLETFWGPSIFTEKSNPWILDIIHLLRTKDTKRGGKQYIYIYIHNLQCLRKTQDYSLTHTQCQLSHYQKYQVSLGSKQNYR